MLPKAVILNHAQKLDLQLKKDVPEFQLKEKRVWYWWLLYYVALMPLWSPKFTENTWVTVGYTVYVPNLESFGVEDFTSDYMTLYHERRHMLDLKVFEGKYSKYVGRALWFIAYAAPQIFSVLSLLAFVTGSYWWLLCLLFLGPWPAPFRVWAERRGYLATFEAYYILTNTKPSVLWIDAIVQKHFSGWTYIKMSWRPKSDLVWFLEATDKFGLAERN